MGPDRKSSIFDSIRLLKSAYGQYHQNEYQAWFSEFQINVQRIRQDARRVLHDPTKPLRIRAEFEISVDEQEYLRNNANNLYLQLNWTQFRGMHSADGDSVAINPTTRRAQGPVIESQTAALMSALNEVIDRRIHIAELSMAPDSDPVVLTSPVVELMFSIYRPQHLGVVDYHGPHRSYGREQVGGINLHLEGSTEKHGQHALYNTQSKYSGVKTELAQSYIRQLLVREANEAIDQDIDLKSTLDELFGVFFPGKRFLGVRPTLNGGLEFPVRLENGREHDINELSSGEKEVLLGYLRLRNSAPRNSIILLDEPELHLNPRLIRGLPRFYQKHLGDALRNQIWMITHSDALLREAADEPAYAVFHMLPSYSTSSDNNQVDRLSASLDIERAIIDLVGDLATYSPRSKVVLLEGENSEADANMIRELFPEFVERVNLVSAGSKRRVGELHSMLEKASKELRLDARFYSIVDRDSAGSLLDGTGRRYSWDVYHIENFLLEPRFIIDAMRSLQLGGPTPTESEIEKDLALCASETIDHLVRIKMEDRINTDLISCISTRYPPSLSVAEGFQNAAKESLRRLTEVVQNRLTVDTLEEAGRAARHDLESALTNGRWRSDFKDREVLRRISRKYHSRLGLSYERLRNLIINRMREEGFKPPGMARVINEILTTGEEPDARAEVMTLAGRR